MNFQTIFAFLSKNYQNVIYGVCVLAVMGFYTALKIEQHERAEERKALSNTLAQQDRLRVILKNEYGELSGRYVFIVDDINKLESENKLLSQYLKNSKSQIEALAHYYDEVVVENQNLKGRLRTDSLGEFASFDTSTANYTINLDARLRPEPLLTLHNLIIPDSSTVAFLMSESGTIRGIIQHSNPFIHDRSGAFYVKTSQTDVNQGSDIFPYILGGGVGLVTGYLIRAFTHK